MDTHTHVATLLERPADEDALLDAATDEFGLPPEAAEERHILGNVRDAVAQLLPGLVTVRILGTRLAALGREQGATASVMLGQIRDALLTTESQDYVADLPAEEAAALQQEAVSAGAVDAATYLAGQASTAMAA